jgi:DNA-directed RNA polymerase subunit RPC12/RpoP
MAKRKRTPTRINTRLWYQNRNVEQNSNNIKIKTELQLEIECLRCHDTMMLCSDFKDLYYFCEHCGFLLHTQK